MSNIGELCHSALSSFIKDYVERVDNKMIITGFSDVDALTFVRAVIENS